MDFNPDAFTSATGSKDAFLSEYNLRDNGAPRDDDRGVHAEFILEPVLLGFRSKQEGRAIYEDQEFVSIRIRGSDKTHVMRPATDADRMRFPRQYAAFRQGQAQAKVGTPIEKLQGMSPATALMYRTFNISTVEDLAEVADGALQNLGPGARDFQRVARTMLSGGVDPEKEQLKAQLEQMRAEQAKTQVLLAQLLEAQQPKKRGRKPKVKNEPADDLPSGS